MTTAQITLKNVICWIALYYQPEQTQMKTHLAGPVSKRTHPHSRKF